MRISELTLPTHRFPLLDAAYLLKEHAMRIGLTLKDRLNIRMAHAPILPIRRLSVSPPTDLSS